LSAVSNQLSAAGFAFTVSSVISGEGPCFGQFRRIPVMSDCFVYILLAYFEYGLHEFSE
ncbi:unnamed protein product, partial [marine sediment metagenome]